MKEQPFSLPVYLLGYPIALTIMVAFYISEILHGGFRLVLKLFAVSPMVTRK